MLYLLFLFAVSAVALMASVFVWHQVRQLMSAVRWAYSAQNYTMAFWAAFAVIVLLFCLFLFGIVVIDLIDGRLDIVLGAN